MCLAKLYCGLILEKLSMWGSGISKEKSREMLSTLVNFIGRSCFLSGIRKLESPRPFLVHSLRIQIRSRREPQALAAFPVFFLS